MASLDAPRSFTVKPEVVLLQDLFEEIGKGKLRCPNFQRAFSWKLEDMRSLFDSVFEGFPIGSLLIWEPGARYESLDRFGPIPQGAAGPDEVDLSYVLDGQHRLATLHGVIHMSGDRPPASGDDRKWFIWYDLRNCSFTHGLRDGELGPQHIPLRILLRTTEFLRYCTELLKALPQEGPQLIERAEQLAHRVRGYRMAVVRIRGGKIEHAIEIFARLNSSGKRLSPDQLASALTYRENSFDLKSKINDIFEQLTSVHFGGISRTVVLRAIAGIAGIRIQGRVGEQVASLIGTNLDTAERDRIVEKARAGMFGAAKWLAQQGVLCNRLLPYNLQIILLAIFFAEREPTRFESTALHNWFFATSFASWFAGGNTTLVSDDLDAMRRFARGEIRTIVPTALKTQPFPDRFYLRSARVRAFLVSTLVQKRPLQRHGLDVDVPALFQDEDEDGATTALPRIFPKASSPDRDRPANRILLPTLDGKGPRELLLELPEGERTKVLSSHCISEAAWKALIADDAQGFISARTKDLIGIERDFMRKRGIGVPAKDTAEAPFDADT